jgi:hypothetical protein
MYGYLVQILSEPPNKNREKAYGCHSLFLIYLVRQAGFEPRLNSSGISLTLNLRPTDS